MRNPVNITTALLIGLFATMVMGCSETTTITMEEAIQIARDYVEADGVMTIDDAERDSLAADEGNVWHVSFPYKASMEMLGGEPHVKVAKTDGTVTEVYYTQ